MMNVQAPALPLPEILSEETDTVSKEYYNIFRNYLLSNSKKDVKDLVSMKELIDNYLNDRMYLLYVGCDSENLRFEIVEYKNLKKAYHSDYDYQCFIFKSNSKQLCKDARDNFIKPLFRLLELKQVLRGKSYTYRKGLYYELKQIIDKASHNVNVN